MIDIDNTNEISFDLVYLNIISDVYKKYNYLQLSREDYIDKLIDFLIKEDVNLNNSKDYSEKIKFKLKVDEFFYKYTKVKLQDKNESILLTNNYINMKLSYNGSYGSAIKNLERLGYFYSNYDVVPSETQCISLMEQNCIISEMISMIFATKREEIISGRMILELEDPIIKFFIDSYCFKNGIECQENFDVDLISKEVEYDESNNKDIDYERLYFKEIKKYPLLTRDEERDLLEKYSVTKDKKIKDILVERNLRWVLKIASRYQGRGMDLIDLFQEGTLGLIKAIEMFDIEANRRLTTYASWWITQRITRAIHDKGKTIRVPVHMNEQFNVYNKAYSKLYQLYNREPTRAEIAAEMKISEKRLKNILDAMKEVVSFNMPVNDKEDTELGDFLSDDRYSLEDEVLKNALTEKIFEIIDKLKLADRERHVIIRRYGLDGYPPETLESVGKRLGVTRERIRQIEAKIMRRMRKYKKELVDWLDISLVEDKEVQVMKEKLTLSQYLNKGRVVLFSDEEIKKAVEQLTDEDKEIVILRYSDNGEFTKEHSVRFYGSIVPKLLRILNKGTGKKTQNQINKERGIVSTKTEEQETKSVNSEISLESLLNVDGIVYFDYEIRTMLDKLSDDEKELVNKYLSGIKLSKKQRDLFENKLISKMRYFMKNPSACEYPNDKETRSTREKARTLIEYLNKGDKKYSNEEIEIMLSKLSAEQRKIVTFRFEDESKLTKKELLHFYHFVGPKMRFLLENPDADIRVKAKSIYEYLNQGDKKYSNEEIDIMLSKLDDSDRKIIELKFSDESKMSQEERNRFRSSISSRMKKLLDNPGQEVKKKPKTIYEYLNQGDIKYSNEEIDIALSKLTERDKSIIELRFSDTKLSTGEYNEFYGNVIPKIKKFMNNSDSVFKVELLYQYLNKNGKNYTNEEIDMMLAKLSAKHRRVVEIRFSDGKLSTQEYDEFYHVIAPKMRRILEKNRLKSSDKMIDNNDSVTLEEVKLDIVAPNEDNLVVEEGDTSEKEDYIKFLEVLKTPTFEDMLKYLSPKEATVVLLKLGYVDGKYFSTESISNFLGIDTNEVREITKKALVLYRDGFVNMIDKAVEVATDRVDSNCGMIRSREKNK